jgi:hypothetical protein
VEYYRGLHAGIYRFYDGTHTGGIDQRMEARKFCTVQGDGFGLVTVASPSAIDNRLPCEDPDPEIFDTAKLLRKYTVSFPCMASDVFAAITTTPTYSTVLYTIQMKTVHFTTLYCTVQLYCTVLYN